MNLKYQQKSYIISSLLNWTKTNLNLSAEAQQYIFDRFDITISSMHVNNDLQIKTMLEYEKEYLGNVLKHFN